MKKKLVEQAKSAEFKALRMRFALVGIG